MCVCEVVLRKIVNIYECYEGARHGIRFEWCMNMLLYSLLSYVRKQVYSNISALSLAFIEQQHFADVPILPLISLIPDSCLPLRISIINNDNLPFYYADDRSSNTFYNCQSAAGTKLMEIGNI